MLAHVMKEPLHMMHAMESCGWVEKIKARLSIDGLVASVKGKSEAFDRRTTRGGEA